MTTNQHLADAERWLEDRGPYNSEYTEALVRRLASAVRSALVVAKRLDDASERCAAKAPQMRSPEGEIDLLARASTYQECAGLVREAVK